MYILYMRMYVYTYTGQDCLQQICHKTEKRNENLLFGHLSDIHDGSVYKEMVKEGVFLSKYHISVILNTDGIPVFRSSSFSFWPIHLLVNELPFRMRYKILCMYKYASL